MISAIDTALLLTVFLGVTAVGHLFCALGVLFYHMKVPPQSSPSIAWRFLITLLTGAIGLVYFIFIKRDLQPTLPQESVSGDEKR